jgi:hypothetical protein
MERMYVSDAKFIRRKHGPELVEIVIKILQVDDKRIAGMSKTPIRVTLDGEKLGYVPMYRFMIRAEHPNVKGTKYDVILTTAKPIGIEKLPFYKDMKIIPLLGKGFSIEKGITKKETDNVVIISEDKVSRRRKKK